LPPDCGRAVSGSYGFGIEQRHHDAHRRAE
jgi:hypothetical protein